MLPCVTPAMEILIYIVNLVINMPNIWENKPTIVIVCRAAKVCSDPIKLFILAPDNTLATLLNEKYISGYLSKDVEDKEWFELIEDTMNLILFTLLIIEPIVNINTIKNIIICGLRKRANKRTHLLWLSSSSSSFSSKW